jgi:hypothetical protein
LIGRDLVVMGGRGTDVAREASAIAFLEMVIGLLGRL